MTAPASLSAHQCVALGRRALQQLRLSLERDVGLQAAAYLQEAGFAAGAETYHAFSEWLASTYGVPQPDALDAIYLNDVIGGFFREWGWGTLVATPLADAVMGLDSLDWAEAIPGHGGEYPSCHLSSGLLADFLGHVAGASVAVMEVECRTRGDGRCRFLVGAPETLATLYERMSQGMGYEAALGRA